MNPIYLTEGLTDRRCAIPILVPWKLRWAFGVLVFALVSVCYALPNHFPLLNSSQLPLTRVDRAIPFLPWTVWIYLGGFLYPSTALLVGRCTVSVNKHMISFLALAFACMIVFFAFPITYPRELFPLPTSLDPLTTFAFKTLRRLDNPVNCWPSLHVSVTFLIALGFLDERRNLFPIALGWASLIAVSTLTTKQHYAVDILGGILFAAAFFAVFHRWLPYRLSSQLEASSPKRLDLQ